MRQQEKDDGTVSVQEKKTIPLVEEDEDQVTFAMRALRKHGIVDEVAVAGDGNKAVDYVFGEGGYAGRDTSLAPGFVLLDVDLRGVSGLEVLEKVRSDERTELLPIILFSASTRHGDRSRATSWGPTPTSPNPPASRSSPSLHPDIVGTEKCEAALAADRDSFETLPTTRGALDVGYCERYGPYVGDWQNRR